MGEGGDKKADFITSGPESPMKKLWTPILKTPKSFQNLFLWEVINETIFTSLKIPVLFTSEKSTLNAAENSERR